MTEEQKKAVAVFRFGVIADFVNGVHLDYGEQERLLAQKSDRKWDIPHSGRTRIGRSTIQRWVTLYQESVGRLESLYPSGRSDAGRCRSLDEETELSLRRVREEMPKATARVLVEEMEKRRLITGDLPLSCVYRVLPWPDDEGRHATGGSTQVRGGAAQRATADEIWTHFVLLGRPTESCWF